MMNKRSWLRPIRTALLVASFALAVGGCDGTLKYVRFPVTENGRKVYVEKFFNDAMGLDGQQTAAYNAIVADDYDGAQKICERAIASNPSDPYNYYNLAIVHEIRGNWDEAERAIQDAIRVDAQGQTGKNKHVDADFQAELRFIQSHKGG